MGWPPEGFWPSEEEGWGSSMTRESMMSWRSFSIELTIALCSDWTLSPGAGGDWTGLAWWFPLTKLSVSEGKTTEHVSSGLLVKSTIWSY